MVKGPGLYTDIGKKTRDLLYKDYQTDQKFSITTYSSTGVAITSTGLKKGELFVGDVATKLVHNNLTTDVKVDTKSNVLTTFTADELAPGVKTILTFVLPDQKSGKLELQYLHEYAGISTSVGLNASPILNVSTVLGTPTLSMGTDVAFDSANGNFIKCNAGVNYSNADFTASLNVIDKGETAIASYYHSINPLTAFGAELTHKVSTSENTLTIGTQHVLDPLTAVKARVNNYGKASALIQHEWRPKSLFTISAEMDTRAPEKSTKVGLALALKP